MGSILSELETNLRRRDLKTGPCGEQALRLRCEGADHGRLGAWRAKPKTAPAIPDVMCFDDAGVRQQMCKLISKLDAGLLMVALWFQVCGSANISLLRRPPTLVTQGVQHD